MKYFILIFIIFFSITLFGQRSGGRIGGSSFDNESSSSYSSSGTSSNNSGSSEYSTGSSYSQTNSNSFFGNDSSSSGFTESTKEVMAKITHNAFIQLELKNLSEETYLKIQNHKSLVKQLKEENKPEFTEIKEYIIFTLIVTCKNLKIEKKDDYSYQYYSTILQQLKNIDFSLIQAVDVIWTPDAENDVLTEDDIIQNYNNLKTV